MKQQGNLFDKLISMENLELAHKQASKGKSTYTQVAWVNSNKEVALGWIHTMLKHGRFTTSPYKVETALKGNKVRTIHKLPYFPDRIVQHALVNVCKEVWIKSMIRDTFQSLPSRGTFDCFKRVRKAVKETQPKYAMKIDITKFYPSVCSTMLVENNIFKVKCKRTLKLIKDILLSLPHLPLGNHTSQYAGNLVLTPLDWFVKQVLKVRHYFRYCDDLVILGDSKQELKNVYKSISDHVATIGLSIKPIELFNMDTSYLSFVGYRFSNNKTLLRSNIAVNCKLAFSEGRTDAYPSFYGWTKHCNASNLFFDNKRKVEWKLNPENNYQCLSIAA